MFGRKARLPIEAQALGESDEIDRLLHDPKDSWDKDINKFVETSKQVLNKIHQTAKQNITTAQHSMKKSDDSKLKRYSK